MQTDLPANSGDYFIDPESGAEMARLLDQDYLITKGMGGLFSERTDLSTIHRIVDLACGPGGWAQQVALAYPKMEVEGVDISQAMIGYAQAFARVKRLSNVDFRVVDITQPLDFPDASFDLVNARFLGFLSKNAWPKLMRECLRITRPGGIIRLTESEWGFTTSPAYEKLYGMFADAMRKAGQSFSPSRQHLNITPMLGGFLRNIGCIDIQQKAHVIDFSAGTEDFEPFRQNWLVAFKLLEPFCIKIGTATQEEFDHLYKQMDRELLAEDFRGIMFLLTTWGERP
jgi:ubiquinone/menaquinone biosynthesis C-methylase UbiE